VEVEHFFHSGLAKYRGGTLGDDEAASDPHAAVRG
jgi:hypothetical protein